MKKIRVLLYSLLAVLMLVSCDENGYLRDLYVAPKAAFEIEKENRSLKYQIEEKDKEIYAGRRYCSEPQGFDYFRCI